MVKTTSHRCTFCHGGNDRLIAGPGVFICSDCVGRCTGLYEAVRADDVHTATSRAPGCSCSFCGAGKNGSATLFAKDAHFICSSCLSLCVNALEQRQYTVEEGFARSGRTLEIPV